MHLVQREVWDGCGAEGGVGKVWCRGRCGMGVVQREVWDGCGAGEINIVLHVDAEYVDQLQACYHAELLDHCHRLATARSGGVDSTRVGFPIALGTCAAL